MSNFYIVNRMDEECFCANCGMLIMIGERVYPTKDLDQLSCCVTCREELEKERKNDIR